MAAPTLVTFLNTDMLVSGSTSKSFASITTQVGDVIVVMGLEPDQSVADLSTPTNTGGTSLSWTQRQVNGAANTAPTWAWTAIATDAVSKTITVPIASSGQIWGAVLWQLRGSDGFDTSAQVIDGPNVGPSLDLTTSQANDFICVACVDWDAVDGASRTWRTTDCGALTEDLYHRASPDWTVYAGHHADAGAAASGETVGLSAPSTQSPTITAVAVKGTATSGTTSTKAGTIKVGP